MAGVIATPAGLAEGGKCFCLDHEHRQRLKLYLLNVRAATGFTPSQLAAAGKCFCYPPEVYRAVILYLQSVVAGLDDTPISELVESAACYCFEPREFEKVELWLLANLAGLQDSTPSQLAYMSRCFCLDDAAARGAEVYLWCRIADRWGVSALAELAKCYRCISLPLYLSTKLYEEATIVNEGVPPEDVGALLQDTEDGGGYIILDDGGKILVT